MSNQRWTIRGVPSEAVDAIRQMSQETGESAGRLVNQAIMAWTGRAVEETSPGLPADDDVAAALAVAREKVAARLALVRQLCGKSQS